MRDIKIQLLVGAFFMAFLSQNGCAAHVPPYNTVIRNIGTKVFSDSMIIFNKRKLTAGWVSSGNYKVRDNPGLPIPDKAIVSWRREDGIVYEKEIEIKSKLITLADKQEYYLIVDIDDKNDVKIKVVVCGPDDNCINKWD